MPRRRQVESIEAARIERLARSLTPDLLARREVTRPTADVDDVGEWRAAARKAARDLGVPVRTGVTSDGARVWAVVDEPASEAAHRAAARAIDEAFGARDGPES